MPDEMRMLEIEKSISDLRESGRSIAETILEISKRYEIALSDAKKIVHFSKSWSDRLFEFVELHEAIVSAIEEGEDSEGG